MNQQTSFNTNRAFTLIELLVSITVAGVLIALSVPILGNMKGRGQSVQCLSNMRQIGVGMNLHVADNNAQFPFTTHAGEGLSWIETLKPYLGEIDAIRVCPADRRKSAIKNSPEKSTSYVINELIARPELPGSATRIHQVKRPSSLVVLFERSTSSAITNDHVHTSKWTWPSLVQAGLVWSILQTEVDVIRHINSANYLFADGHVESISSLKLKAALSTSVSGTSFFQP